MTTEQIPSFKDDEADEVAAIWLKAPEKASELCFHVVLLNYTNA